MSDLDEQGRPEPPLAGDETATLLGFLEYQRATLAWKCSGLDARGLRVTATVMNYGAKPVKDRAVTLRIGGRVTTGTVRFDAAALIGTTAFDPGFGFAAGVTWVFRAFTLP